MVLIHDNDVALLKGVLDSYVSTRDVLVVLSRSRLQSLETFQPDVMKNCLKGSNIEIHKVSWGELLPVSYSG
jgi:hypothetical protein